MGQHIYRVVVRGQFDDLAPDRRIMAEEQATSFLQQAGFGYKRLRFEPTSMADVWT